MEGANPSPTSCNPDDRRISRDAAGSTAEVPEAQETALLAHDRTPADERDRELAVATFGLVGELGSEDGLPASSVSFEGGAMFVMVTLTALWVAWLAAEPRTRQAGMVAVPASLQR